MDVDPAYRLRGALLAAAGVAALAVGGWWWQAAAPAPGGSGVPPGAGSGVGLAPDEPSRTTEVWQVDRRTGSILGADPAAGSTVVLDSGTGAVLRMDGDTEGGAIEPGYGYPGAWRPGSRTAVWTEHATLDVGESVVRQAQIADGESHLLRFSCTGPGELLVMVAGGRAADPLTAGCDGAVTMTEITGTGGPVRVSFSPAGAEPIQLEAELIALW